MLDFRGVSLSYHIQRSSMSRCVIILAYSSRIPIIFDGYGCYGLAIASNCILEFPLVAHLGMTMLKLGGLIVASEVLSY